MKKTRSLLRDPKPGHHGGTAIRGRKTEATLIGASLTATHQTPQDRSVVGRLR